MFIDVLPWAVFLAFVAGMLALDLGVFHRNAHVVSVKEAGLWSAIWVALALCFNAFVTQQFGAQRGLEFLTGYLIEKALAVDNLFVFYAIFAYFSVPAVHQHRVLFWGVLGALVMRAAFILAGAALLAAFHWVIYVFGAILIVTAVKLFTLPDDGIHPERNSVYRLIRRLIPATTQYHGARFAVKLSHIQLAYGLGLLADVSAAVSASFAYFVVLRISEAQEAKLTAWGRGNAGAVPLDPRDAVA